MGKPEKSCLSKDSIKLLADVKKGKMRKFVMVHKGVKILSMTIYKRGNIEKYKKEALSTGKGEFSHGLILGQGFNLQFHLARTDGFDEAPTTDLVLKKFLVENTSEMYKPTFEIVDVLPVAPDVENPLAVNTLAQDSDTNNIATEGAAVDETVDPIKKKKFRDALAQVVPPVQRTLKSPDVAESVKSELRVLVSQLKTDVANNQFDQAKMAVVQIVPIIKKHAPPSKPVVQSTSSGAVDYGKARLVWDRAQKRALSELEKLKQAMLAQCEADPEDFEPYRESVLAMDDIMSPFENELPDLLDDALNAQDTAKRQEYHEAAALLIKNNIQALENNEFFKAVDTNPVLPVPIYSTLAKSLAALAAQIC